MAMRGSQQALSQRGSLEVKREEQERDMVDDDGVVVLVMVEVSSSDWCS